MVCWLCFTSKKIEIQEAEPRSGKWPDSKHELAFLCTVIVTVNVDNRLQCAGLDGSILFTCFSIQGHFQPCVFFLQHTHTSTTSFLSPNHPRGQSGPHITLCSFKYPYIIGHCYPCWCCPGYFVPQSCYSFFRHHPSGHLTFRVISVSSR